MANSRNKKFDAARQQVFLEALRKGHGRSKSCGKAGITRQTFRRHYDQNPEFQAAVIEAETDLNELVESSLLNSALKGNVTAQQVWLYNRAPSRWADKRNVERYRPKDGKTPDVSLKSPEDIRKVCETLIATMFQEGTAVDAPNQVAGLMKTWMEAFGLEKIETLEKKIAEIEKEREKK